MTTAFWTIPTMGSSDLFHTCASASTTQVNPFNTHMGVQPPYSGNAYGGGFTIGEAFGQPYREYLQTPLTSSLVASQLYSVSMWVNMGDFSEKTTDSYGVYFSDTAITSTNFLPLNVTPQVVNPPGNILNDTLNWQHFYGLYQATGGEQFITIGNFLDEAQSTILQANGWFGSRSFHYVDEVVIKVFDSLAIDGDSIICVGDTGLLIAEGYTNYSWADSANPTVIISTNDTLFADPTVTTTYYFYTSTDTLVKTLLVRPLPTLTPNDTTICDGDTVVITPTGPNTTALWLNTFSTPSWSLVSTGSIWAKLTDTVVGCEVLDTADATFIPAPQFDLGNDTSFCFGDSMMVDGTVPGATYLWHDGSTVPIRTITISGNYVLEVSNGTCSSIDSIFVLNKVRPYVDLGNDTSLCENDTLYLNASIPFSTHLWQDNSTNFTYTVVQSGLYWVENQFNGCLYSDSILVTFSTAPVSSLGPDTVICSGESLLLLPNADTALTYVWNSSVATPPFLVNASGTHAVTISNAICSSSDTVTVTVQPLPFFELGPDTIYCEGDSIPMEVSFPPAFSFIWNDQSTNPTRVVVDTGNYSLQITDTFKCSYADSRQFNWHQKPVGFLPEQLFICFGETLQVDASVADSGSYLWNDGDTSPMKELSETGIYQVQWSHQCGSYEYATTVSPCTCEVFVPSAFTPNYDNLNGMFLPKSACEFSHYSLRIFNRWGEQIFATSDPTIGWNGEVNGQPVPSGNYLWRLEYEAANQDIFRLVVKHGKVSVVR